MRANAPLSNDLSVTQLPTQDSVEERLTPEQLELAKIGKSPDWKIITTYLEKRIESYKKGLFGEDLKGKDPALIGNRFLAAQSVIQEFEALIDEVNTTTRAVDEASEE